MRAAALAGAGVREAFRAETLRSYEEAAPRLGRLARGGAATLFQQPAWLGAWYGARAGMAAAEPLIVFVSDARGADVMALALVRVVSGGGRAIEFADGGVSDYNGPILGAGAPQTPDASRAMWRAVRRALPGADILRLTKMPRRIGGMSNPLALLPGARAAALRGNILEVSGPWDAYHRGLERTFRKELERSWRVFSKCGGARFALVTDPGEAARVYAAMRRLQSARIGGLGLDYILDRPENDRLYAALTGKHLGEGSAILSALTAGDEVVAALLGIRCGADYAMVRLAAAGGGWKRCSPGRLVIERTMRALHETGVRRFDFTIGDYPYKRRLGAVPKPLVEIISARSWRGVAEAGKARLKSLVRARPALAAAVRRLRGPSV